MAMTTTDLDAVRPHSPVYGVRCPHCRAEPLNKCIINGDQLRTRGPHAKRWDDARYMFRNREMWHVIKNDDPRFGLVAGDIVRTVGYPYDAKVTVLFRECDGYEPGCNQYVSNTGFLGFVPRDMEVGAR